MTKNYNNAQIDDTFNKVMCCYNNLTIDFPKTQQNISLGEYEDTYNELINQKPPYFFQYAKDKKKFPIVIVTANVLMFVKRPQIKNISGNQMINSMWLCY